MDRQRATKRRRGVLLINLGTPDGPDARSVRRYLAELLSDPEVIRLPRGLVWLNPILGRVVSRLRAAHSAEKYQKIWTDQGSPLLTITQQQVSALESMLSDGMRVFCAMRYGRPGIAETLRRIEALGIEDLVVVPMYPQFSGTTTLTAIRELYRHVKRAGSRIDITTRNIWYDDAGYVNAQARLVHDYATAHGLTPEDTHLVYSLHSLPVSYIDGGDPYADQIRRTAELVTRRLGWPPDRTSLGFQSRLGPVKWLRPTTTEVLAELSRAGQKQILVCPLSFTTDCLETLEEIGIGYREQFETDGGRLFLCPAPNASEPFIAALKNLVLHGRHPISLAETEASPLMAPRPHEARPEETESFIDSLFMVGMSLSGRVGPGRGPHVAYADMNQFRNAKRSQRDVPEMLRAVRESGQLREALLWNTCRRFEFYGCLKDTPDEAERAETVSQVRRQLFNNGQADASVVNVLRGLDAWHYLVRTAAGLNSGLPGEREVSQQLEGARRLAERAGTGGPLTERLLAEVSRHEHDLREQTEWGRFQPDYCHASISQIVRSTGLDLPDCRCVVIGGSTTSCAVLDTLAERFDVPRRQLTLLHRGHGHGGHLKMLRKAIGNGRRIRVQSYSEKCVIRAIADADVVFFGLDHKEPVLDAEEIRDCRDFTARPLAIIDFNMFGSTTGMEGIDGVRLWKAEDLETAVAAFAEDMCGNEQFARAAEAAESWIVDHLPDSRTTGGKVPMTTGDDGVDIEVFHRYAGLSLPRHVSYPMPSWWSEVEPADAESIWRESLDRHPSNGLSLYVHVPFCESQCKFCACNRMTLPRNSAGAAERTESYVRALEREIRSLGRSVGRDRRLRQIHWGGGSPTYLSPESIERLCTAIEEAFSVADDAEIAMEIDPRRVQPHLLKTLRRLGFTRLSLGVQDFDEQVQRHVRRIQPFEMVRDTVQAARDLGFNSINFDLIYGLPYQTLDTVRDTIERTIELSPDRVAFYHYAQIPEKIAAQRGMDHARMPDSDVKLAMFLMAARLFREAGYVFIGLDHFAKPDEALASALENGTLQRNFQGMTTGGGLDLLGVGASSISHLRDVGFLQNTRDVNDYVLCVENDESPVRCGKRLTLDDCIRQAVINQLYCTGEIRPTSVEDRFGIDFSDYFSRELKVMHELERDNLVTVDPDNAVRLSFPLGRVLMRNVAAPFDAYLEDEAYRVGDRRLFSANA